MRSGEAADLGQQVRATGNVVLIFLGLGVVGFAIGTLTRAVIQFGFGLFFGRRRMQKEISKLRGDFIFCDVGRRVALEIAARNLPLVIVEQDPSEAQWVQEENFPSSSVTPPGTRSGDRRAADLSNDFSRRFLDFLRRFAEVKERETQVGV